MAEGLMARGALVLAASASAALGQDLGDPDAGGRFVALNCAQCHGAMDAPGGAPAFGTIAMMPSTSAESLNVFLRAPHAAMSDLILSPGDRSDVIAYILSLRP